MRFGTFVGILAGVSYLAGEAALAADDGVVLEPASAWAMNYDDDSCALQRLFKNSDGHAILEFRRFSPTSATQVSVTSDAIRPIDARLKYRFGSDREWRAPETYFAIVVGKDFKGFTFAAWIPADAKDDEEVKQDGDTTGEFTAQFKTASSFSLTGGFRRPILLQTGPLLPAHNAMETCLDELLTHWGIDAEAHKSLTRWATPADEKRFPRRVDYPHRMLMAGKSGLVHFRLAIDENGTVTRCHIQRGISDTEFERSTCHDLEDVKFDPALDKDGRPIASYYANTVTYHFG